MSIVLYQGTPAANTPFLAVDMSDSGGVVRIDGLNFCNQDEEDSTYGYAVVPGGEALAAKHYFEFETKISAKQAIPYTGEITLKEGAKFYVVTGNALTSVIVTKAE